VVQGVAGSNPVVHPSSASRPKRSDAATGGQVAQKGLSEPRRAPSAAEGIPAGHRCGHRPVSAKLSASYLHPILRAIVNRIRAARQALGWTQNELADKAGVSPRTIHAVEKGRDCRQTTKRQILFALGVPWELRAEYFVRARPVRRGMINEFDRASQRASTA
jgi:DNA-binding XRE family transcriptional regulator